VVRKTSAAYGKGQVEIDDDLGDVLLSADELIEIIDAPSYQPPVLPVVALEIYELSRRSDLDLRRVLRLLEHDPMLAARVLRLARSPAYASRVPVASLADALHRLGLDAISRIVLEAACGLTLFRTPGYEVAMDAIRRHSTATAYLARAVAHATRQPTEPAFLCGLLHDVGVVACLLVFARPRGGRKPPPFALVAPVITPLHGAVSARLARLWNLPAEVARVLGSHRAVEPAAGTVDPLAGAVCVADALAADLGAGWEEGDPDRLRLEAVREQIGFPPAAAAELETYGRQVVTQLE
jgi:HD-like signal output (HDOD) protein